MVRLPSSLTQRGNVALMIVASLLFLGVLAVSVGTGALLNKFEEEPCCPFCSPDEDDLDDERMS